MCEVTRILKNDGRFLLVTSNTLHPAIFLGRLVPGQRLKSRIARSLYGRNEESVFRAYYRINNARSVRRVTSHCDLDVCIDFLEMPFLFSFSYPLFRVACSYETMLGRIGIRSPLPYMFIHGRKRSHDSCTT